MNLFCFSLEGSTDSLYEAVESCREDPPRLVPSRSCSPALLLDNSNCRGSRRSISMEIPHTQRNNSRKKQRRTHLSKSGSDNEALDNTCCNQHIGRQGAMSRGASGHSSQIGELRKSMSRTESEPRRGGGGDHQCSTKKKKNPPTNQSAKGSTAESKSAAKKIKKSEKKLTEECGKEGSKKNKFAVMTVNSLFPPLNQSPEFNYQEVGHRSEDKPYFNKSSTLPLQECSASSCSVDSVHLPGGVTPTHTHHQLWSEQGKSSPSWGTIQHTCRRPLTAYHLYSQDFTSTPDNQDMVQSQHRNLHETSKVPRSITGVDLSDPNRSTSFGRFEGLRHQSSQSKLEENSTNVLTEDSEVSDNKSSALGKKMKAISLTMCRKIGKKQAKTMSEEGTEETDKDNEAESENTPSTETTTAKSRNSLESLFSGQSTSSGVTSESINSGHKDSIRNDDVASYQGQFCGRARVHTDFVPSPYDTDSLKLKVGDIINVISKPPMGIWTGMLNNKVGNFKFIYVEVLVEQEEQKEGEEEMDGEKPPVIRQQRLCRRPRPKTLLELLERLKLEEYASALLLNGYQTVDDLKHLQEKHLIELNVTDPEHRQRMLAAAECLNTEGEDIRDTEDHKSPESQREEDSDCPRDSGCFIPSECSDGKDESGLITNVTES